MENRREFDVYSIHDLVMKRPASAFCHRWRDATPVGSGFTGALITGGTAQEQLIINRYDLWHGGADAPVPDISAHLETARALYRQGNYMDANDQMYHALLDHHYGTTLADMRVLGCVDVRFSDMGVYRHYRRILHMDTAEVEIVYDLDGRGVCRRYFASRKRDIIVMEIQTEQPETLFIAPGFYHSGEGGREEQLLQAEPENARFASGQDWCAYSSVNEGTFFGMVCRAISDGAVSSADSGITVLGSPKTLLLIRAFSEASEREKAQQEAVEILTRCPGCYETLFAENLPLYQNYYHRADVRLFQEGQLHTNEALLEQARDTEMSVELAEKLWRFGRYLFISGTAEGGYPFALYGLWAAGYQLPFTHNVANENVQSIYWHADAGGLSSLVRPLLDYYHSKMETFRENARQIYGCRGIFVGTYTTPKNAAVAWYLPVILHFCGAAGWMCSHFYRYYRYTGDEELLEKQILPFMLETAQFYEDYHFLSEDGKLVLYPGVSPENSPKGYWRPNTSFHLPTTQNPTIEIAIARELLQNLLTLAEDHPQLTPKTAIWQDMLSRMPDYRINADGAAAEWIAPDLPDSYAHRHISHLYPVFPGDEYERLSAQMRMAFRKAADLRMNNAYCGWSLPHLSAIYARLQEPEQSFRLLSMLPKCCLLENFFTMGYDYRFMGICNFDCGTEFAAPVQLDAALSAVNAVQEMLLYARPDVLRLLPACPKKFSKGQARLHFPAGEVFFSWDLEAQICQGKILAQRSAEIRLELPFGREARVLRLQPGEEILFS